MDVATQSAIDAFLQAERTSPMACWTSTSCF
jgi:hypothetical protein